MGKEVSRRQFLTGVGVAGMAAAGASMLGGCSPTTGTTNGGSAAGAGSDLIAAASLNPQDYDYRQNTTDFKTLFSPLKIGSMQTSHRMVKSAAGSATYLGGLTDELFDYYVNFAKGGVEIIWIEGIPDLEPPPTGGSLPQASIDFGKKLAAECAKYGTSLGYQWAAFGVDIKDMPKDTILKIEAGGVAVAQGIKQMGFKAIELNVAGFNQGEKFLSRIFNKRTDEYGVGSLENRARFVTECITKIKAACGSDFTVQVLMDCVEEDDNVTNNATLMDLDNAVTAPHNLATTVEEGIGLAQLFEKAGADAMHLRLGPLGNHPCQFGSDLYFILNGIEGATGYGTQWDFSRHWDGDMIGNHSGAGMLIDIVKRYKEKLSIPCGTVTYMDPAHAPDFFEQALEDGKVDFFIMNRPLTVDTEYVNKLRDGRIDEIAPCTRCLHCHIGSNPLNRMMGYCRVNALTQRVMAKGGPATYELPAATTKKKVMVIGGGPGGMEAARIAAARGHKVTLYEKTGQLGGMLAFASTVKGPHENLDDLSTYLRKQQDLNGVDVVLNKEVDAAFIKSEAPDAVVLATGGKRSDLDVKGNDSVKVVNFEAFMTNQVGDDVVIYGSNAQAFDCALWLTVHKKRVNIVTPDVNDNLDMQQSQHAMRFMTTALYSLGVKVWTESSIKSVGDGEVTVSTGFGTMQTIPCDTLISGAEMESDTSLLDGASVKETYKVGDCAKPYNIALAIRAGNDAGRAL